jgi:DNA mismatch repair protein MutH
MAGRAQQLTDGPKGSRAAPAPRSHRELWARARALCGRTAQELAYALEIPLPQDPARCKGYLGRMTELALGADPTAGERPDFPHLGVELKTIPVTPEGRPKQSTFVCSIHMMGTTDATWETSRLKQRLQTVLLMPFVQGDQVAGHTFLSPVWWQPDAAMWQVLRNDWEDLIGAIGAGRGGSLTAREGRFLQVRPKAANARVRALGPSEDGLQSLLPLGFYLRAGGMARVLACPQAQRGPK